MTCYHTHTYTSYETRTGSLSPRITKRNTRPRHFRLSRERQAYALSNTGSIHIADEIYIKICRRVR